MLGGPKAINHDNKVWQECNIWPNLHFKPHERIAIPVT